MSGCAVANFQSPGIMVLILIEMKIGAVVEVMVKTVV
jgi:hypothetical protein